MFCISLGGKEFDRSRHPLDLVWLAFDGQLGEMMAFPSHTDMSCVLFKVRLHMMCATHPNIVQIIEVFANSVQFPHESSPR